jgi:hypothetical protein
MHNGGAGHKVQRSVLRADNKLQKNWASHYL